MPIKPIWMPGELQKILAQQPPITLEEAHAQADQRRALEEPELERLRRDKSWDRNAPKSGFQVRIAVEELMADKSWDRTVPKDWLQEMAADEEERRGGLPARSEAKSRVDRERQK